MLDRRWLDPTVYGLLQGQRVQAMIFESPDFAEHDQPGVFQHIQMFHDADTGRIQLPLKAYQGLVIGAAQPVQHCAPRGAG